MRMRLLLGRDPEGTIYNSAMVITLPQLVSVCVMLRFLLGVYVTRMTIPVILSSMVMIQNSNELRRQHRLSHFLFLLLSLPSFESALRCCTSFSPFSWPWDQATDSAQTVLPKTLARSVQASLCPLECLCPSTPFSSSCRCLLFCLAAPPACWPSEAAATVQASTWPAACLHSLRSPAAACATAQ